MGWVPPPDPRFFTRPETAPPPLEPLGLLARIWRWIVSKATEPARDMGPR